MLRTHEEITIMSEVECTDGVCGKVVSVVIDPVQEIVTHIVVKTTDPGDERLVPAGAIVSTSEKRIKLNLCMRDVAKTDEFLVSDYVKPEQKIIRNITAAVPFGAMGMPGINGAYGYFWPLTVQYGKHTEKYKHENIPQGQLAIRRGTKVEAKDGYLGTVDEFVVDPDSCTISHLVLRKASFANGKDIAIPYADIADTSEKAVYLSLNKKQVGALPPIELLRHWD